MTPPSTILAPDRERASAAAWGTLCLLAVVQIGLAVRLLTTQQSAKTLSATAQQPVLPSALPQAGVVPEIGQIAMPAPVLAPPLPGTLAAPPAPAAAAPVWSAPPPIGSFQQTNPAPAPALIPQPAPMPAPVTSSQPPSTPAPAPAFKPDPATQLLKDVNYVVTTAKEIRGMSDMQGALEMLKRADELTPDHPAIIAEIAQTYEQMGVATKATDSWRRIQLLGETNAGSFYQLASRRLGAGPAAMSAPLAVPGANGLEGEKNLRLGACQVARDFSVNNGERYTVRVPISRAGSQPVDGKAVNLEVFFFDRVNGAQVAQSIAPEPVETWQSAPVDWSGSGEETLDVVYHLPALSAAEIQQHGRRSYYGYMLRLYYNNKLQDVAAEPRDLLEFGSAPGSAPAGVNPLLPPMGR
ncbi:MAG: hypothetical protein QE570_00815 [Verrucomicrobiota bacterium]|nr:hypothetical protein [Verrucomicrobiota bacterium]